MECREQNRRHRNRRPLGARSCERHGVTEGVFRKEIGNVLVSDDHPSPSATASLAEVSGSRVGTNTSAVQSWKEVTGRKTQVALQSPFIEQ